MLLADELGREAQLQGNELLTRSNHRKRGENCPISDADAPCEGVDARTRMCLVISVTRDSLSNAASSMPPICKNQYLVSHALIKCTHVPHYQG